MKTIAYISIFMLVMTTGAFAQQNNERITAIKIAFITDKLHLTSEQATHFWPIYNSYNDELSSKRKGFYQKYKDISFATTDDKTARRYVDDNLDIQEDELITKRKYKDEFLKVISARQLAILYKTEREFKQMLIQQLKDRQDRHFSPAGRN